MGHLPYLSAFSGIGGLDLGLERAGFLGVGAIESDATARDSLAANRPDVRLLEPHEINEVARNLTPRDLGLSERELVLLAAGPPCQPFSKAAQWSSRGGRGMADDRASCLNGLVELVEQFLPHALLIENVPGFVQGGRSALPFLKARLGKVNRRNGTRYRLHCRMLNAVDLGVPQRRKRAFILALRDGGDFVWPSATHAGCPVRAWDALMDVRVTCPPVARGRFAGLLMSVPEGKNYQHFTERGDGPSLFGYRRRFWSFLLKLAKAEPSWTLSASPGPATGPFHWENRPLAPEEMLRLQSFPSSWRVVGLHRERVRQAGNATPPLVAEVLGRSIASQLFDVDFRSKPLTLAIQRAAHVPPPTPPQSVAAPFMAMAGSHDAHPGTGRGPQGRQANR